MWFYILLFSFCILVLLINHKINNRQRKYLEIFVIIILCFVSGTRYYLGGTDYSVYKTVFDQAPNIKYFFANYLYLHEYYETFGFETGYLFLNSLIKSMGFNFFGFTLFLSIFFYVCLYIGLKKYMINFNLLIIIFLYKLFFYNTFISMRQSITIAIFFLAIHFIEQKKPTQYFLSVSIAVLFHNAALMLIPIYFINKLTLTKSKILIANMIFIPTILISFFNLPILRLFDPIVNYFSNPIVIDKANNLFLEVPSSSIGIFHILEYFLIMFLVIKFYDKVIKIDNHAAFVLKIFLILLPMFTIFSGYEIITRLKDYFILSYAIILGYLCLIDNGKYVSVVYIGAILVCAFGFFRFIILFDGGAMMPYESFLLKGIGIFN